MHEVDLIGHIVALPFGALQPHRGDRNQRDQGQYRRSDHSVLRFRFHQLSSCAAGARAAK
ncbi:hypothetical protein D3C83_66260 [compost metagenome]